MATTFFLLNAASTATIDTDWGASVAKRSLGLNRGDGANTITDSTVASLGTSFAASAVIGTVNAGGTASSITWQTNGQVSLGGSQLFISNALDAVTFSGTTTVNLRGSETSTMANYTMGAAIYGLTSAGVSTLLGTGVAAAELGTTEGNVSISITPSGSLSSGDQLVIVPFWLGFGTSASGFSASFVYDGTTSAGTGDSFATFTETITEQSGAQTYTKAGSGILDLTAGGVDVFVSGHPVIPDLVMAPLR